MSDVKLSEAQIRVLQVVHEKGRCSTSKTTHHGFVSGVSATALVSRGLLRYVHQGYEYAVEVTPAGCAALAQLS